MDPAATTPRFPHLDGVRAIAALSVVLVHTSAQSTFSPNNDLLGPLMARMDVGVPIFFVLSGFLLYRPFVAARLADADGPAIGGYLRRRALRIIPAYWLALTVLAIWPGLSGVFTGEWWVYYGFAQNLQSEWILQGIGPAWTLHVEVTFYALLPVVALAGARRLRGRPAAEQLRLELWALAAAGAASLALRMVWFEVAPERVGSHLLPQLFLWFAGGMALAVLSAHVVRRPEPPTWVRTVAARPWLPWAGALALLLLSTRLDLPRTFVAPYTTFNWFAEHVLYALISVLLVLPAAIGTDGGGWVRRVLLWRPLAWIGLVSYGLYLWHLPLTKEFSPEVEDRVGDLGFPALTLAVLAASLTAAALSYYLVERPLMRRFRAPVSPRSRAARGVGRARAG